MRGAPLDQRADLYSLGALAYWTLTGRHAYPARHIEELIELWKTDPLPPSAIVDGIPAELEALVLSLLSGDPLARPSSAAEVIVRLNTIADLMPEGGQESERLAQSFLLNPRFVGRAAVLAELHERTERALRGRGAAVRIEAGAGMGRTRLLEEVGVRAQLEGGCVLRVDAGMHRQPQGTARALALRMLDAVPKLSRESAKHFGPAIAALGREVEARIAAHTSIVPAPSSRPPAASPRPEVEVGGGTLDGWFVHVSRTKLVVIEVDNLEDADDASLALLVALARASATASLLSIVTERERREPRDAPGLASLRGLCARISLSRLSPAEVLELVRSFFGAAPNVERLSEWLHGRSAGSPLHAVEILRQLISKQVVRYIDGVWALPSDRPGGELPAALGDALLDRLSMLGEDARSLAECLNLQRGQPTLDMCRLLFEDDDDRRILALLDELARSDVVYGDQAGYRFSSTALREALLVGMDDRRLRKNHNRLGRAFARLAEPDDYELRLEAGWHLIKGGEEMEGADLIAEVTHNSAIVRSLTANLLPVGEPIDAALRVYKRHRRSAYARFPLLTALAYSGYYERLGWGNLYGDEALDACEESLRPSVGPQSPRLFGRWLGLVLGIGFAFIRFKISPAANGKCPFREMFTQLFGATTTLTGLAAMSLDFERATQVAGVLDVFSVLPERTTFFGIYQFCMGLREIGRERQTVAFDVFDTMLKRLGMRGYYPTLNAETRPFYVTGAHYARGAFAIMLADGRCALESADALDASGLKLYAMIASQLRFLYYMNRGEFSKAAAHREQVELHAAHMGSTWQVQNWEGACLIPVYTNLCDVEALTRITAQLRELSATVPSLKLYARLAQTALMLVVGQSDEAEAVLLAELQDRAPRSFIGWASTYAFLARGYNARKDYAAAKRVCEEMLTHISDADKEYVALFLAVDIEMALAQAGLGEVDAGLARIDALLARFRDSDNPLVQGLLHEARAKIAWMAGLVSEYSLSLTIVEHWFRRTGTSALVAKCERLADLQATHGTAGVVPGGAGTNTSNSHAVTNVGSATLEPDARTVQVSVRRTRESG